jgi:hypothetical protein
MGSSYFQPSFTTPPVGVSRGKGLDAIGINPLSVQRTAPESNAEKDRSSALRIGATIPQCPARRAEIWTAVAERSGDTAFRAWPSFRKRHGASLPAAVHIVWLRRRPPAARQASSRQPGAGKACGTTCRPLRKKHGLSPDCNRSQPGGLPEGSRWSSGARGERPPEDVYRVCAPRRGARRGLDTLHAGSHDRALRNQSGTPAGVQVNSCAAIRRSPPPRPPSTCDYPLPTLRVSKARMSNFQRAGGKCDSSCHPPYRSYTALMGKERNIALSADCLALFAASGHLYVDGMRAIRSDGSQMH